MESFLEQVGESLVFVIIGVCFIFGMFMRALTTILTNTSRERSRREIAAYIAEGSISPEQGERLLRADVSGRGAVRT